MSKVREMLEQRIVDVSTPNKSDVNNTALHTACDEGDLDMVKLLVDEFQANMNAENLCEELPVHLTHEDEIISYLLSRGSKGHD